MQDRSLTTTLLIFGFLAVILFRLSHPLNDASAKEWLEKQGYTAVNVVDTEKRCFRKKRYTFTAEMENGETRSGTLCLSVVRPFSTISEK